MTHVLVTESNLSNIADAIRDKTGSSDKYTPNEMAEAIRSISGGGIDVSSTTATASDVKSGKTFFNSSGTNTTGTLDLINGVIRPDAERVERLSSDKYLNGDLGVTIPAYTTTSTTLVSAASLTPTVSLDLNTYDYQVLIRMATIPEYSVSTVGKGRQEYAINCGMYEITSTPANTMRDLVTGTKYYASQLSTVYQAGNFVREVYYSSGTALAAYASAAYGYNQTIQAPALSSTSSLAPKLTLKSPIYIVRGHTTYFTNTYMNAVTDVRYQYVIEVYRAPKLNYDVDGWGLTQQWLKANADILTTGNKLI